MWLVHDFQAEFMKNKIYIYKMYKKNKQIKVKYPHNKSYYAYMKTLV